MLDATIFTLLIEDSGNLAEVIKRLTEVIGKRTPEETIPETDEDKIETVYN